MAIAFDNSTLGFIAANSTNSFSHTITGSNLVAFCQTTDTATSVSCGGVSMTLLQNYNPPDYSGNSAPSQKIWVLLNPGTGAKTIEVVAGTNNENPIFVTYSGVAAGSPYQENLNETGVSLQIGITDTLTTVNPNAWMISFVMNTDSKTCTGGTGTTVRETQNGGGYSPTLVDSNGALSAGSNSLITNLASGSARLSSVSYELAPVFESKGSFLQYF